MNLEPWDSARLAGQRAPENLPVTTPTQSAELTDILFDWGFHVGSENLELGLID